MNMHKNARMTPIVDKRRSLTPLLRKYISVLRRLTASRPRADSHAATQKATLSSPNPRELL